MYKNNTDEQRYTFRVASQKEAGGAPDQTSTYIAFEDASGKIVRGLWYIRICSDSLFSPDTPDSYKAWARK